MAQPGGLLSRQISSSHVAPRSLLGYQTFFRQNSPSESGWLEIRLGGADQPWTKYWAVFDSASGKLSYSQTVDSQSIDSIPISKVVSFRTVNTGSNSMLITTTEGAKIHLRAGTADEMKIWLFCFQKSVALVLSHLIEESSFSSSSAVAHSGRVGLGYGYVLGSSSSSLSLSNGSLSSAGGDDSICSQGSGADPPFLQRQSSKSIYPSSRRRSANDASGGRAYTDEDIESIISSAADDSGVRWERSRSTRDLSRLRPDASENLLFSGSRTASIPARRSLASHNTPDRAASESYSSGARSSPAVQSVAMSPAIPIFMGGGALGADVHHRGEMKVAGSYNEDSFPQQLLEDAIRVLDLHTRSASDQGSDCGSGEDEGDSELGDGDGMLIFDLDEMAAARISSSSEANGGSGSSSAERSRSRDGRSRENSTSSNPRFSPFSLLQGGPQLSWTAGSCSKLGPRSSNEDRVVALPDLSSAASLGPSALKGVQGASACGVKQAYFAVYDGHCGHAASTRLQETLHEDLAAHPLFASDLPTAVAETCVQADRQFLDLCREKKMYCGTTALGAVLRGSALTVFNIGDCQAVLCSGGAAVQMSSPHQPGRPDEAERITKAGGWITEEKELYMGRLHRMDLSDPVVRDKAQQVNWVTITRVCGELAVSRSIGDPDYKGFTPGAQVDALFNWPEGHAQAFQADLVIPVPELVTAQLTPNDEFLILASDGLWDVVSSDEAVVRTRLVSFILSLGLAASVSHPLPLSPPSVYPDGRQLFAQNKTPSEAAEELCELALKLGSSDNCSVVLVQFHS